MSWTSGYHRVSDDSVSSFGGHLTREDAEAEATGNLTSEDIDEVWVRQSDEIVYHVTKQPHRPPDPACWPCLQSVPGPVQTVRDTT